MTTPIECVRLGRNRVFVKRDDLYGSPPFPPLGKLRGLKVVLEDLYRRGVRVIGAWDTRVSRLGEGLAAACQTFPGMTAVVSYPTRIGCPIPDAIIRAERMGAQIIALRGNHVAICYAQAKHRVEELGGVMLPFGLECAESVDAISREASTVPLEFRCGTVALCCGSGVTLAGIINGMRQTPPLKLIGISSGRSIHKIEACVRRYSGDLPKYLQLRPAIMPYDQIPSVACPFPTHPNYDLKAWMYLRQNVRRFPRPILFWNIGA